MRVEVNLLFLVYLIVLTGLVCGVLLGVAFSRSDRADLRQQVVEELRTLEATERLAGAAWDARQELWRAHQDVREPASGVQP